MSKFCVNCGTKLIDEAVFCSECGVRQTEQSEVFAQESRDQLNNDDVTNNFYSLRYGFCIEKIFEVKKKIIVTGKVAVPLQVGGRVYWSLSGERKEAYIGAIEKDRVLVKEARFGETVGVLLEKISRADVEEGCVLLVLD